MSNDAPPVNAPALERLAAFRLFTDKPTRFVVERTSNGAVLLSNAFARAFYWVRPRDQQLLFHRRDECSIRSIDGAALRVDMVWNDEEIPWLTVDIAKELDERAGWIASELQSRILTHSDPHREVVDAVDEAFGITQRILGWVAGDDPDDLVLNMHAIERLHTSYKKRAAAAEEALSDLLNISLVVDDPVLADELKRRRARAQAVLDKNWCTI